MTSIGFACDTTVWGGAEACLAQLIPLAAGRDVVIFAVDTTIAHRLARAATGEVRIVMVPAVGSAGDPRRLVAWTRLLTRNRVDLLHINAGFTYGNLHATAAAVLTRTPYLVQEHLPLPGNHPRLQRPAKRALVRRAAAHIAVSEQAARDTERLAGLAPGTVRTITNGIDLAPPAAPGVSLAKPTILATGRLIRQKGFDLLVAALPSLPGLRLALVGDGPERDALEKQAAALGVGDRVSFLGWRDDARGLLTLADVIVIPSRAEAGPLVLLEALAAGRPVVVTRVGVAEEVIDHDRNGWLVPTDDVPALVAAVRKALADPAEAALRAGRGQLLVRDSYGREAMLDRWRAVYDELLPAAP